MAARAASGPPGRDRSGLATRPQHVWVDGRLVATDRPQLLVSDRGFQLGDGLFETLRARRAVIIEWEEHLARLVEGAAALRIAVLSPAVLEVGIRELLDAEHCSGPGDDRLAPGDASLRITISRGSLDQRGTLPAGWSQARPTVVIQAWPWVPPAADVLGRGLSAIPSALRRDPASPLAGIKATSRADHVYARLEAEATGADDAVFLTLDGRLSESTSANLWVVSGSELVTPPRSAAILAGTTRTWLLADPAVAAAGLRALERDLRPSDLAAADEAFLSSSVAGIVPLTRWDGRPIGTGRPGRRTEALRLAREAWIDRASLTGRRAGDPAD